MGVPVMFSKQGPLVQSVKAQVFFMFFNLLFIAVMNVLQIESVAFYFEAYGFI